MERRDFLVGLGTLAVAATAHAEDHPHGKGGAKPAGLPPASKELVAVVDATAHCLKTGGVCLSHCNALLAGGDTSLGDCQRTVMNMLAVCDATFKTASYRNADPKNLKALAKACADFCRACAKACEPHAAHHEECKACYDSCVDCAKACDAYSTAA
jgi:Cys-rich four helix bundle protein (predicted Tat secretion target)